jgi:hypothetical protein
MNFLKKINEFGASKLKRSIISLQQTINGLCSVDEPNLMILIEFCDLLTLPLKVQVF